jgi:protein-tyrosine kinase
MGRVQDAMRRAAETSGADATTETTGGVIPAFPEETHDPVVPAAAVPPTAGETDPDLFRAGETQAGVNGTPRTAPHDSTPTPGARFGAFGSGLAAKLVLDPHMLAGPREQYRHLAAGLHRAQEVSGVRIIMIASAVASEGKSLTAANLALTFSESYKRSVLLIDGDLRRPAIHRMFGMKVDSGLSETLVSVEERPLVVGHASEYLTILPAGRSTGDPMAGLTSVRMKTLLAEARGHFDWVFIDTPPVGLLTDANLLAAMVDAVVLVVKAGATPYPLVQRAVEALGRERILGAVLNQVLAQHGSAYDYYNYRYHYASRPEASNGG